MLSCGADLQFTPVKRLALTLPTFLLAACGSTIHNTTGPAVTVTQSRTEQPNVTQTVGRVPPSTAPGTDRHDKSVPVINKDGTYVMDMDIWPGIIHNAGGTVCYWARLRSLDPSDVIDSNESSSPQVVTLHGSDTAFLTRNCGTWQSS